MAGGSFVVLKRRSMMIQSAHRHIYGMILLLIVSYFFSTPDLTLSGYQAVSTSKAVFYVY
jgi:hypothetical protein